MAGAPSAADAVTIVIPTFNKIELSLRCLDSILAQNMQCRIVVVDNGSVDGSVDRIRASYPSVHIIANPINLGVTAAWNQGLSVADDGIVGIVNNDIIFHPHSLQKLVDPLRQHEWIGCTTPETIQGDYENIPHFMRAVIPDDEHARDNKAEYKVGYAGWCFFFRRSDFPGTFWKKTHLWYQDKDFLYRILFHTRGVPPFRWPVVGKVPVVIPGAIVTHAHHASHGQLGRERVAMQVEKDRQAFNRRWRGNRGNAISALVPWGARIQGDIPAIQIVADTRDMQGTPPQVSVIIPVFNRPDLLQETLAHVQRSTLRSVEIIIVDDGSAEDIYQAVHASLEGGLPHVIARLSWNSGPGIARRVGLQLARGTYVQYLDSDDIMHPDKLLHQVDFMERHPKLVMTYCLSAYTGTGIGDDRIVGTTDGEHVNILDAILRQTRMAWTTSSCLWRRKLAGDAHCWHPLFGPEDILYDVETGLNSHPVARTPGTQILLWKRVHDDNISGDIGSNQLYQLEILKMYDLAWQAIRGNPAANSYIPAVGRWYRDKIMRFLVFRRYHEVAYILRTLRQHHLGVGFDALLADMAVRITGNVEIYGLLRRWWWVRRAGLLGLLRSRRT